MTDLISIVVPVYNIGEYLPRCLDSILMQTYPCIEIIVVDDGSKDNSSEIIDEYAKKHKNVIAIHKKNGGVTEARLVGVAHANGEWIGFVDGDDEIEPDMYERLIKNAKKNNALISHCGYQMCFEDGRVNYFYNTGKIEKYDNNTGLKELLVGSKVEPGLWNKLFHKTLFYNLLTNKVMDTDIRINEDLLMNYHLFSVAELSIFEDWCPYHYIVRRTSASRAKLNYHKIYDPIHVKEFILTSIKAELREEAQRAYLSTCISVYNSIILEEKKDFEQDRKNIRELIVLHKKWRVLLSKKRQILAILIHYIPFIYRPFYRFYETHILKNRYE